MACKDVNTVIIIGGGLVGSLCAIFMAKRGYRVTVYECREDIRSTQLYQGRSINLALSNRGRRALSAVGLEDSILRVAIPMKGRMLHDLQGESTSIPYDKQTHQCIYSVSRNFLNRRLLAEAESYANVEIRFNYKLTTVNFEEETIIFVNTKTQQTKTCQANLIIGADGAFSTLRRHMQLTPLFEFSQTYIKHAYLELTILPETSHRMTPNHLHIWPRGEFMMIALPNQDKSWTVTLFMPFANFEALRGGAELEAFFQNTFPDAISLIGKEELLTSFFKAKPSPLVSIKCNPYHVGKRFLLIGDAAHAMVPFYGQGMNAGFEDCLVLDDILNESNDDVAQTIKRFSLRRVEDAHAICDLAFYNYTEMRDLVNKRSYYLRKSFDELLFRLLPEMWIPLYNSVTFSSIGYKKCVENRCWQNKIIRRVIWIAVSVVLMVVAYGVSMLSNETKNSPA